MTSQKKWKRGKACEQSLSLTLAKKSNSRNWSWATPVPNGNRCYILACLGLEVFSVLNKEPELQGKNQNTFQKIGNIYSRFEDEPAVARRDRPRTMHMTYVWSMDDVQSMCPPLYCWYRSHLSDAFQDNENVLRPMTSAGSNSPVSCLGKSIIGRTLLACSTLHCVRSWSSRQQGKKKKKYWQVTEWLTNGRDRHGCFVETNKNHYGMRYACSKETIVCSTLFVWYWESKLLWLNIQFLEQYWIHQHLLILTKIWEKSSHKNSLVTVKADLYNSTPTFSTSTFFSDLPQLTCYAYYILLVTMNSHLHDVISNRAM